MRNHGHRREKAEQKIRELFIISMFVRKALPEGGPEVEENCLGKVLLPYLVRLGYGEHEERKRGCDSASRYHIAGTELEYEDGDGLAKFTEF